MYSNLDLLTFTVLTDICTYFNLFLFIQLLHAHFLLAFSNYNSGLFVCLFLVVVALHVWTVCMHAQSCLILCNPMDL